VEPNRAECEFITLLCTMNRGHDRVIDYFLLPDMRPYKNYPSMMVASTKLCDYLALQTSMPLQKAYGPQGQRSDVAPR
jgi:hypothetical protein